jgi:predicted Zn-dependent peptidase
MIDHTSFTLPNGLRVVHHHDTTCSTVVVNILYRVGAKDESPQLTGLAHLFEHLMFGGSANVADFDNAIELAGGWNNAWTSNDYTNFYEVMPACNAETAFWAESDRMLALAFSDKVLDVQKNVVCEEFQQTCLNRPYGDFSALLRSTVFKKHPYAWQTLGKSPDHVRAVTHEDVKAFFYSHYAPNNAVLAVAGNISAERTRELAEKWFGDIPSRPIAPRTYPAEPPVETPRSVTVRRSVPQAMIAIAYPMMEYGHPLYEAADILSDILAVGKASRFYRNLIAADTPFTEADASILGSDDPGYFLLNGRLKHSYETTVKEAFDAFHKQMELVVEKGVEPAELERAVNKFESNYLFSNSTCLSKAQNLAMCAMHGEDINSLLPRYRALTPDTVNTAARLILNPQRECALTYLPKE